jgi:hypothetical protein
VALESERLEQGLLTYGGLSPGANGKRAADLDGDGKIAPSQVAALG